MTRWSTRLGYVAGAAMVAFGAYELLTTSPWSALRSVAVWFGGGVLAHDAVLAPVVVVAGLVLVKVVPPAARSAVQGALVVTGTLVLATLPLVLGMGRDPRVPSQQPLAYGRNLVLVVVAVWLVAAVIAVRRVLSARRGPAGGGTSGSVEQGPQAGTDLVPGPGLLDPGPPGSPQRGS